MCGGIKSSKRFFIAGERACVLHHSELNLVFCLLFLFVFCFFAVALQLLGKGSMAADFLKAGAVNPNAGLVDCARNLGEQASSEMVGIAWHDPAAE